MQLKRLTSVLVVCGLVLSSAYLLGEDLRKEQASGLLQKSLSLRNIRAKDSPPFQLVARLRLQFQSEVEGTYRFFSSSPETWREEIELPEFQQTIVRNGDKKWIRRSADFTPARINEVSRMLWLSAKPDNVSIRKVKEQLRSGISRECIKASVQQLFGSKIDETLCIDPASGQIVEVSGASTLDTYISEFSNFTEFAGKQFPQTLRGIEDGKEVAGVSVQKVSPWQPDPTLLMALPGVEPWTICDDMKPPQPIHDPAPEYPVDASREGRQGTLLLYVVVGADGKVQSVAPTLTLGASLDAAAVKAVKDWRFKPAMCGNSPTASEINVEVTFHSGR